MGKIDKISDQMWKLALQPPLIGQDADKNEYWFFKGDLSRIFVRTVDKQEWFQYDELEAIMKLEECLNPKGIRERKLQEQLKKTIKRLKCKKWEEDQEQLLEDHTKRAVNFGKKNKSDVGTRKSIWGRKKKVDDLSIDCVREKLIEIEASYSEAISPFERNWTSDSRKEVLVQKLLDF